MQGNSAQKLIKHSLNPRKSREITEQSLRQREKRGCVRDLASAAWFRACVVYFTHCALINRFHLETARTRDRRSRCTVVLMLKSLKEVTSMEIEA